MNGKIEAAFIGTCGRDAETRIAKNGTTLLTTVTVAVGTPGEEPQWVRCALFGESGQDIGKRLVKGSKAYFEGELSQHHYQTQDGQNKVSLNLRATKCEPVARIGRRKSQQTNPPTSGGFHAPIDVAGGGAHPALDDAIPF
jgi:single stranded DNA-binding protein